VPPLSITVFVVDDHELVRRGLIDLIDAEEDLAVVGQAGSVSAALEEIKKDLPNVAVLGAVMGDARRSTTLAQSRWVV